MNSAILNRRRVIMKKRALLILTGFIVLQSLTAEEYFYENLSNKMRNNLSGAYNVVSGKYDELGNSRRADEYSVMSDALRIGEDSEIIYTIEDIAAYSKEEKAARYYFNKYSRAFFTENRNVIATILDSRVLVPFNDEGLSISEMLTEIDRLFALYDLEQYRPEDVYDMTSIKVEIMDNGYVRLDIEILDDYIPLFKEIIYWNKYQSFYFKNYDNKWKLSAISGTGG